MNLAVRAVANGHMIPQNAGGMKLVIANISPIVRSDGFSRPVARKPLL